MKQTLAQRIALYASLTIICAILVFPIYWTLLTSLMPENQLLQYPPKFLPVGITFAAYQRVLSRTMALRWLLNSSLVTAGTIALSVPISSFAGYAISRFKVAGIREIGYSLLIARMLPASLMIIPLYYIFRQIGLVNNLWGMVVANTTFIVPFATWMMKGFFDSIPPELEDSAQVDGCSIMGAFFRVILPLSLPGLAATTIYSAILSWSEFLFASTLASGENLWTVTVGVASFVQQYLIQWSDIMAAALLFMLPMLILFTFLEKYLVGGLTAGSVKG